jgi:hypothetical protein
VDETDTVRVLGFPPKGQTLVIRLVDKKNSRSVLPTIANRGKARLRFMQWGMVRFARDRDTVNADLLITSTSRLIKDTVRKILFALVNFRAYHYRDAKQ